MVPGVKLALLISVIFSLENGALVYADLVGSQQPRVHIHALHSLGVTGMSEPLAACRSATVYNLPEVPPMPSHLFRQGNHYLTQVGDDSLRRGCTLIAISLCHLHDG